MIVSYYDAKTMMMSPGSFGIHPFLNRKETYDAAILPLDDKLVLEHNEVLFTRSVLHETLKTGAEGVEEVDG